MNIHGGDTMLKMDKVKARVFRTGSIVIVCVSYVAPEFIGKGMLCSIAANKVIKRLASVRTIQLSISDLTFYVMGSVDFHKERQAVYSFGSKDLAILACYDIMRLLLKINDLDVSMPIQEVMIFGKTNYEKIILNEDAVNLKTDITLYEYVLI